jgi:hypothetical protein
MAKLKLTMVRDGMVLRPFGNFSCLQFEKIKTLKQVIVTVHQARNPEHHNKFWAIAAKVADFDRDFEDADDAVRWVKRQIPGMHRKYKERDGTLILELESISVESMDQIAFEQFYERALALWAERIGCDPEALLEAA